MVFYFSLQVNWEDERSCFQTISAALANFYAMHPPILPNPSGDGLQHYRRKPVVVSLDEELNRSGIQYPSASKFSEYLTISYHLE